MNRINRLSDFDSFFFLINDPHNHLRGTFTPQLPHPKLPQWIRRER